MTEGTQDQQQDQAPAQAPVPQTEERFNIYGASVSERQAVPELGLDAVVQLQLDSGIAAAGVLVALKRYTTGLDPDTAEQVGQALVDSARELRGDKPKLDVVTDLSQVGQVAARAAAAAKLAQ